jgi:hypothetical protein
MWTEQREDQLRAWWNKGHSGGIIARLFCDEGFIISRNAVIGKVNRLGLSQRTTAVKYSPRGNKRIMRPEAKPPRKATVTLPLGAPVGTVQAPKTKPAIEFGPRGELCGCAWIEGDPMVAGWFYCNAPRTDKSSYCEGHAALCYVAIQPSRTSTPFLFRNSLALRTECSV